MSTFKDVYIRSVVEVKFQCSVVHIIKSHSSEQIKVMKFLLSIVLTFWYIGVKVTNIYQPR